MGTEIQVDIAALRNAANTLQGKAGDYRALYNSLFAAVDNMQRGWTGTDNAAFTAQIREFRNDFESMRKQIDDYAVCLRRSADMYEKKQQEIATRARELDTGK